MRCRATQGGEAGVSLSDAIRAGAPAAGGLYLPERDDVRVDLSRFAPNASLADASLAEIAAAALAPFFAGDRLEGALEEMCRATFAFDAPLKRLEDRRPVWALELFHGPTGAFKDFGARFLAEALSRLRAPGAPMTIVTATSGDTGGAVGAAFESHPEVAVAILFPKGRVSPFQEHQLCCWRGGVSAYTLATDFDACQALAKAALADPGLRARFGLTSANSINLGRLLPQMAYYARSSLVIHAETGLPASYVIPTGNLGNAAACSWAKAIGFPIDELALAANANRTMVDFAETGAFTPRASIATLANAMDVGAPNNFARLGWGAPGGAPPRLRAFSVDDAAICARIKADDERYGVVWCPHSATAAEAYARLEPAKTEKPWVVVATAHPAKFAEVVEPAIGRAVAPPPAFTALLERPARVQPLEPTLEAFSQALTAQTSAA